MECTACKKWYHKDCAKLSDNQFKVLEESKDDIMWCCPLCKEDVKGIFTNYEKFKKMNHEIEQMKKTVDKEIKDFKTVMTKEMNILQDRMKNFKAPENVVQRENVQEIVKEVFKDKAKLMNANFSESQNILERKNNLLFFKIPESDSDDYALRMEYDFSCVKTLYENYCVIEPKNVKNLFRIGKKEDGKVRPLLVKFENSELKTNLLRNSKDLKLMDSGNASVYKIGVSPDRTQMERDTHKNLVNQIKERTTKGEKDLIIRGGKILKLQDFQKRTQEKPKTKSWAEIAQF